MPEFSRQSALQDHNMELLHFECDTIELRVVTGMSKLRLQARSDDPQAAEIIATHLGRSLSNKPLVEVNGDPVVFWCAPNEWLLVGNSISVDKYRKALSSLPTDLTLVITDLSDSLSVIELRGTHTLALLEEGCGVDLHEDRFTKGRYVMTRFAHLPVIIHKLDDDPRIQLYIDRNVARYLWDWLQDGIEKSGSTAVQAYFT